MKLVKVKDLRDIDNSKAVYVYKLIEDGKLKRYIQDDGYVYYDEEEYETYKRTTRQGRPTKAIAEKKIGDIAVSSCDVVNNAEYNIGLFYKDFLSWTAILLESAQQEKDRNSCLGAFYFGQRLYEEYRVARSKIDGYDLALLGVGIRREDVETCIKEHLKEMEIKYNETESKINEIFGE